MDSFHNKSILFTFSRNEPSAGLTGTNLNFHCFVYSFESRQDNPAGHYHLITQSIHIKISAHLTGNTYPFDDNFCNTGEITFGNVYLPLQDGLCFGWSTWILFSMLSRDKFLSNPDGMCAHPEIADFLKTG